MSAQINWEKVLQLNSPANEAQSMLVLLKEWLGIVWLPALGVIVSLSGLVASVVWQASIILIGALLSAACVALLIFWGALSILNDARYSNNSRVYQWEQDKEHLRQISLNQLDIERERMNIDVKVLKGGTANINSQVMQNQMIVEESKMQSRAEFMLHFAELIREANRLRNLEGGTGFERKHYLAIEGKRRTDYRFDCDGREITKTEYNQLMEHAKTVGLYPEGRRKGSAGKIVDVTQK